MNKMKCCEYGLWLVLPAQASGNSCPNGHCKHNDTACCTKEKSRQKTFPCNWHQLSLNIGTDVSNLLRDFLNSLPAKTSNLKIIKHVLLIFIIRTFCCQVFNFFNYFLVEIEYTNLCNDHNNKVNVLPQLVVPSIVLKFSGTKVNSLVKLDVYG
jgi:hypothetical protein